MPRILIIFSTERCKLQVLDGIVTYRSIINLTVQDDDTELNRLIILLHDTRQLKKSRDSSVGIATDYGLDDRIIGVRIPVGAGNFSLRHRVQTGSGAHPVSYPMGTRGSFPGGKAAAA
jgi:hypothetical protein